MAGGMDSRLRGNDTNSRRSIVLSLKSNSSATNPHLAANRRNALKSTGPRSLAGKRRVALNALKRPLCAPDVQSELQARGEDPREFRRLYRDLIALFQPREPAAVTAVELLARTWWEKARRIRGWVAAGPARVDDLDAQLDELLQIVILSQRLRKERWQCRLAAILGRPVQSATDARCLIEGRLFIFGAQPGKRKYARRVHRDALLKDFDAFRELVAELGEEKEKGQGLGVRF